MARMIEELGKHYRLSPGTLYPILYSLEMHAVRSPARSRVSGSCSARCSTPRGPRRKAASTRPSSRRSPPAR